MKNDNILHTQKGQHLKNYNILYNQKDNIKEFKNDNIYTIKNDNILYTKYDNIQALKNNNIYSIKILISLTLKYILHIFCVSIYVIFYCYHEIYIMKNDNILHTQKGQHLKIITSYTIKKITSRNSKMITFTPLKMITSCTLNMIKSRPSKIITFKLEK
jgi:hypothetical protein